MANRTTWTLEKRREFLEWLRTGYTVTAAARMLLIPRSNVYHLRSTDAEFADDMDAAMAEGGELMEQEAWRRATQGVVNEKGIYHQGRKVGADVVTEYSDTLLIFLLKGRFPDKYRERVDVHVTVRQIAERLAAELGLDPAEVVAEAETILRGRGL